MAISLAAGWLLGWGFLRVSNRKALAGAISLVRAHLMELRLFADEPALVWTAQWDLVKANGLFLWCMMRPLALLAIPAGLLMWQLEPFYSRAPLQPGEQALVTVDLAQSPDSASELVSSEGITVETQPVLWNRGRNASWRIRAERAGVAQLPMSGKDGHGSVQVVAGDHFIRLPLSQSLNGKSVRVGYPERSYSVFGWSIGWATWFLLWSSVAAMASVWWLR